MAGSRISVGQRVRIDEQDEPANHVGRMATVEKVDESAKDSICLINVDWEPEPLSLPARYLLPIQPVPSSLLANDLYLPWDPDLPADRLSAFTNDATLAGIVLEDLFFYDRIVIPTVDFAIIVPLVHWLGLPLLTEMLASQALSFIRYRGSLGYVANGHGLELYELHQGQAKADLWWANAAVAPCEESIVIQLKQRIGGIQDDEMHVFARLVAICTAETALPEFKAKVQIPTGKAWEFRGSRTAREFRDWFDAAGPEDVVALEREYVKALRSGGLLASTPARIIRFLLVQAIPLGLAAVAGPAGAVVGLAGSTALSLADSFLLDNIRLGHSPRYFIDDLRHGFFPIAAQ